MESGTKAGRARFYLRFLPPISAPVSLSSPLSSPNKRACPAFFAPAFFAVRVETDDANVVAKVNAELLGA